MESAQGPPSPVVEQEASIFKENFVPPELSIWDYFIAKVWAQLSTREEICRIITFSFTFVRLRYSK